MRYLFVLPMLLLAAPTAALEEGPAAQAIQSTSGDPELDGAIFPAPRSAELGDKAWKVGAPVVVSSGAVDARVLAALAEWLGLKAPPAVVKKAPAEGTLLFVGGPDRNAWAQERLAAHNLAYAPESWGRAKEQGYALGVARDGERLAIVLAGASPAGDFYAVQTLKQLSARDPDGALWVRQAAVADWPGLPRRGIKGASDAYLEAFTPLKLNFGWTYSGAVDSADKLKDKPALIEKYHARFAAFAVSYNPGEALAKGVLAQDGGSPAQRLRESVRATYDAWAKAGADAFVLSLDDQSTSLHTGYAKDWPTYWAAQAELLKLMAETVRARAQDAPLYWCPHRYGGTDLKEDKTVAGAREAGFPEGLRLCWTGRGVVSHRLKLAEAEAYGASFGLSAKLFYYNWPITAPDTRAETGPMPPADPALAGLLDVWMLCSNHDRASEVAFLSGLAWAWNPEAYDPERATKLAAREWARRHGGAPAYAPLVALLDWTRAHDSLQICPDQAQKSPEELASLVADEEAFHARHLPVLKSALADAKLVANLEAAFKARMAKFRGIVENQKHMRKGRALKRAGEIVLDGKLDEEAWSTAAALEPFVAKGAFTEPAAPPTAAKVLYDDDFLYVGLKLEEPSLDGVKPYTEKTGWKIQHGDYVQLNLDCAGDRERVGFACTTLHGQASMFDFGAKWMDGFEVQVGKQDGAWIAEFKLPLARVPAEQRPAPGRAWGFNVIRRRVVKGEPDRWSSWNPLASKDDKFKAAYCGTLSFE
ncbi:MAG: beta-N-acetylglucosaminidase domain-containing protein [Planctomycetota bacterium]|nr:beta-N-acetylglucosaminidase domain-containing protein [Planctomycetota bacterium]